MLWWATECVFMRVPVLRARLAAEPRFPCEQDSSLTSHRAPCLNMELSPTLPFSRSLSLLGGSHSSLQIKIYKERRWRLPSDHKVTFYVRPFCLIC